jgi:Queuosine biosynthesis protein QueC
MKSNCTEICCPEYHFTFGPLGVQRKIPSFPNGEHDFYGQEYFAEYGRIASALANRLPRRIADWIEIATAIYLADRFSPRRDLRFRKSLDHRRRIIRVTLPVSDQKFWKSSETQALLRDALWALTEDDWHFNFLKRDEPLAACVQDYLIPENIDGAVRIALFSGGLDSFAGAASQVQIPGVANIFISGVTHGRMEVGQSHQIKLLKKQSGADIRHIPVWYGLKEKAASGDLLERSQRSRAFMHITLGAAAALHLGVDSLFMYENGYGALNLPFDSSQIGIETSKACNPVFHRRMEKFVEAISGKPFTIVNPFLFLTKAQALHQSGVSKFGVSLSETFSCDRFPDWREGRPQCGTCASCVLRRLSLEAANLGRFDVGTGYARDVKSSSYTPNHSAASVLSHYEEQATTLDNALCKENSWIELATAFPELYEIENALNYGGHEQEVRSGVIQLLRRQVHEWRSFSGRACLNRYLEAA